MKQPSDVEVTVKSVSGECKYGHKVGDRIYFDGKTIKGGICYSALLSILPRVYAMRNDAKFPFAIDGDIIMNACPDPKNPVVYQLRRVKH